MAEQKSAASKAAPTTKLMVGEVRFSYANVHEAKSIDNEDPAYSIVLLLDKNDNADMIEKIKKVIEIAKQDGKTKLWKGTIPPNLKVTLHDGDVEKPGDDVYKNKMFLNARNKKKPGILKRNAVTKSNEPLESNDEFYSGCYGYATVTFFPFNKKSNGVGCNLGNLLKTKDGERLAGGATADEDFESFNNDGDDIM